MQFEERQQSKQGLTPLDSQRIASCAEPLGRMQLYAQIPARFNKCQCLPTIRQGCGWRRSTRAPKHEDMRFVKVNFHVE
jgi:hypothetical protein